MEKLFVTANHYLDPQKYDTKFIALRYGNVLGSSGSVIPKFIEQIKNKEKVTITDNKMTRFSITKPKIDGGVRLELAMYLTPPRGYPV